MTAARPFRPKVLLASGLYPPHVLGGAELHAAALAHDLRRGADVVVLTSRPRGPGSLFPRREIWDSAVVYRFFPANVYHLRDFARQPATLRAIWHALDIWNPHAYLVAHSVMREERPDLVHLQHPGGISTSVLSAAASLGIPTVLTLHDYLLWCRRGTGLHGDRRCGSGDLFCRAQERVQRYVTRGTGLVIAPTQFALTAHTRLGFFPRSHLEVIPYPTQWPAPPSDATLRDTFNLLYLGQLAAHKGVRDLVHAFRAESRRHWRLRIAGRGEEEDRLRALASGDPRIELVLGYVEGEQRARLLGSSDVLIVPSRWDENAPLVVLMAFQAGLPVVASAVGGLPELVQHGRSGLLVPPGDSEALRAALRRLDDDPLERARLSEGARTALSRHDPAEHVTHLLELYARLLGHGNGHGARS